MTNVPDGTGRTMRQARPVSTGVVENDHERLSRAGPGRPAPARERFYRADAGRGRACGGSGTGLTITGAAITARGGTLTASGEGPGTGTAFTITLPAAR